MKKYSLEGITYNNGVPEIFDSKVINDSEANASALEVIDPYNITSRGKI